MADPIKVDNQQRTSFRGFLFSNSDPANRRDYSPTYFSYIDSVLASQLELLEEELVKAPEEPTRERLEQSRDELLESISLRRLRCGGFERFNAIRIGPSDEDGPPFGEFLALLTIFLLLVIYFTAIPSSGFGTLFLVFVAWLMGRLILGPIDEPIVLSI